MRLRVVIHVDPSPWAVPRQQVGRGALCFESQQVREGFVLIDVGPERRKNFDDAQTGRDCERRNRLPKASARDRRSASRCRGPTNGRPE